MYEEPTESDNEREVLRTRARADPLEVGVALIWRGPSLEADVTPSLDYPHERWTSPNPQRPLHAELLEPRTGVSSKPWTLTLVEPLKIGPWIPAQVCRVEGDPVGGEGGARREATRIPLVVKLYQQSFFPFSNDPRVSERDTPRRRIENEARTYRLSRDAQGSDLPLCYGFYEFELPSGESAVGLVLEDLVCGRQGLQLETFFERATLRKSLDYATIDTIMTAALKLQHRLHEAGIARILYGLDEIVRVIPVGPSAAATGFVLVAVGFGKSSTESRVVADHAPFQGQGNKWRSTDQRYLVGSPSRLLIDSNQACGDLARRWTMTTRETKRRSLDFLIPSEVIYHETLEEAQAEEPGAAELDELLRQLTED